MTLPPDPPRLRDDPATPNDVRDLIAAASPTAPPDPSRAATLKARITELGAGAPSMPPAPPAGGGSSPPLAWSGAAALAAAVITGVVVALLSPTPKGTAPGSPGSAAPPAAPVHRAPPVPRPAPPRANVPAAPAIPAPDRRSEPASSDAVDVDPRRPASNPAVQPAPPARRDHRPTDDLAAEQRLLEAARRVLDSSPATALASLDRHGVRFPDGQLAAEREYLAIRALRRLGRHAEADDRRRAFLDAFPKSPYARLLRDAAPSPPRR